MSGSPTRTPRPCSTRWCSRRSPTPPRRSPSRRWRSPGTRSPTATSQDLPEAAAIGDEIDTRLRDLDIEVNPRFGSLEDGNQIGAPAPAPWIVVPQAGSTADDGSTEPTPAPTPSDREVTSSQPDSLRALVSVMDRLRSPGGCPWDAQQTHESLVPYALEEAHELAEAIETGDRAGLREELGDLLLQVVFHARIATEHPSDPFDVDDVAADLVAKLVRRHPHVFEDAAASRATCTCSGTG